MAEPHPVSERPVTILVAEDEGLLRGLVIRLLGDEGFRILEARDGREALHLAHLAWPYLHLVITDVVMPGMDGVELGRRLALDCPGLPVLYTSAYDPSDIFHRGPPDASVPFLAKPFTQEAFLAIVRQLLERASHVRSEVAHADKQGSLTDISSRLESTPAPLPPAPVALPPSVPI